MVYDSRHFYQLYDACEKIFDEGFGEGFIPSRYSQFYFVEIRKHSN